MKKLWVDDVRQPPSDEWIWAKTTMGAIGVIANYHRNMSDNTIIIDLDHDAGDYAHGGGGDYINILKWLEWNKVVDTSYFFRIHTQNPVGYQNMKAIIEHNGWREIK